MIGVRVNAFNENGLGEPEKDANSAMTELDKGLRSGRVGEQCEAIVRFPRLFEKFPFPILINSSLLKLADVFRVGNNFLRVWVLRVCQQSEKHLDKILNVDEFVRRIFSVIHSNDPVARALTLLTLGSVAGVIPERQQVHHGIRRSLDSRDAVEVEAAIQAALQFAAQSKTFALSMCNKISDMIQGLSTPADMKLRLIPVLQHMHHDTATAAMVRHLCLQLLPSYPAEEFVLVTLNALTQLASATLVDVPVQVSLLLKHLSMDPRGAVGTAALGGLLQLSGGNEGGGSSTVPKADGGSKEGSLAHLWPDGAVGELAAITMNLYSASSVPPSSSRTTSGRLLSRALTLLCRLSSSAAALQSFLYPESPLLDICMKCCYSTDVVLASKAVRVMTKIVCKCNQDEWARGQTVIVDCVADKAESLFLYVACQDGTNKNPERNKMYVKQSLYCLVTLARSHRKLCPRFVDLIGSQLEICEGPNVVLLCEALGAIGGFQVGALLPLLPLLLLKLRTSTYSLLNLPPAVKRLHSNTVTMLCTLVFQTMIGYEWTDDVFGVVKEVIEKAPLWATYRIARSSARYGHHRIGSLALCRLVEQVSSEHLHFWLVALREMSAGEALLSSPVIVSPDCKPPTLLSRLSMANAHYAKAVAALKATSTPAHGLQFQLEWARARGEFLQAASQLCLLAASLVTAPPPAIAATLAHSSRDELLCYGHVTLQLRKCAKEFRACSDLYWKLYQSAFDADPSSLANIQILQQMCVLMATNIERISLNSSMSEAVLDLSWQQCSLETQHLLSSIQEASAVGRHLFRRDRETKVITQLLVECLVKQVEVLTDTALCFPRFFFQVLQSTSVKLAISPQPRVPGESVFVMGSGGGGGNTGSQLALKVEGVVQHGRRPGLFRRVASLLLTVSTAPVHLRPTSAVDPSIKGGGDAGMVLSQIVTPHRDFFAAQFLLAFPLQPGQGGLAPGGTQYVVSVEACAIDEEGDVWRTGPRATLSVKVHDEGGGGAGGAGKAGGNARSRN
ncbi:integrator complex subunit 7 [Hetaerina americana]|uniref:integrator complex subunit 7 n=1 Tax=Hetaerina americana TaxID=62018 RepID=UPI003A7F4E8B